MAQPVFSVGGSYSLTVCQGSTLNDFSTALNISDPNVTDIDTWDISSYPSNGTLSGLPQAVPSTGSTNFVTGVTYTPGSSYTGSDAFVIKVYGGNPGDTIYKTVNVFVTPLPSFNIVSIPAVCAGATSTVLNYSALQNLGPATNTYAISGSYIFSVPVGVDTINFDIQGGAGGNDSHSPAGTSNPGRGGRVQGTLGTATHPLGTGEPIYLNVGGMGGNGTVSGATGGFNGGGNASFYFFGCGGAGGGASDIRRSGNLLSNRVAVAGGGGGNGWDAPGPSCGGNGGFDGTPGCSNVGGGHAGGGSSTLNSPGAGATYSGWTSGQNGSLGNGGNGSPQGISGGGGGGYYGGGGGVWSGGGGGSSWVSGSDVLSASYTTGYNIGNGTISLSYVIPGTYSITWDGGASSAGFTPVTGASFPSSPITIAVPPTAPPGTYTGHINLTNLSSGCTSNDYPISVTINPIPDVSPVTNTPYCNGDPTSVILFTGSVPSTTFNWTNDNTTIGLAASGSGNIGSFSATNTGTAPVTSLIAVTPVANGCTGAPISFTYVVNPTPVLTSTLTPSPICDSVVFVYNPTSATTGTSFTWFRPAGIVSVMGSTSSASGTNSPNEALDNTTPNDVVVPYTYVLAANGCLNSENVNVTVHPNPMLSSSLTEGPICNSTVFSYVPTSLTPGVAFMWNRNDVTGISNTAATGTGNPGETLVNTTAAPIAVPYAYTLTLLGSSCYNTQTVTVTVNPTPMLNTTLAPAPVCNNTPFTYAPGSATAGTSFSWTRGSITGISNPPNSGVDTINETLINTTPNPVTVTYNYQLLANGCLNNQVMTLTVYPTPRLSTSLTPMVCDSTVFNYPPASLTAGTTFTWTRAVMAGISNLAGAGFNNPNETLINTTPNAIVVPYVFSLSANGCPPVNQTVNLTVQPKPTLTSSLTPPAICDSFKFNYNPTSATAGCIFTWDRPYIPGIYAVQQTGTGDPNQVLINSTYVVVNVTYVYTVTIAANGCSNIESVTVPVNPTPKLNPPYSATVCSGSPFVYIPTSYTPGATFAWDRPQVPNVGPASSYVGVGTGTINETLVNSTMSPVNTYYYFRLGINGCTNLYTQTVKLTINPTPAMPPITTMPPNVLCDGTQYQNFGTNGITEGVDYNWTATNAYVFAQGTNHQYALVSFDQPGTAVVSLTTNVNNYGCTMSNSYTVTVTGASSETPQVIYYNGQFICLKNDNDTYQWGWDDAHSLDSSIIAGQVDQNYNNANPDFTNKNYWCITTKGGCMQKSYYNRPSGISNVNNGGDVDMKVYPNPATQVLNVEINSTTGGKMQVEVLNMVGQRMDIEPMANNKAALDVAQLPAGCYLVDCYRDGVKVATSRFIKN